MSANAEPMDSLDSLDSLWLWLTLTLLSSLCEQLCLQNNNTDSQTNIAIAVRAFRRVVDHYNQLLCRILSSTVTDRVPSEVGSPL